MGVGRLQRRDSSKPWLSTSLGNGWVKGAFPGSQRGTVKPKCESRAQTRSSLHPQRSVEHMARVRHHVYFCWMGKERKTKGDMEKGQPLPIFHRSQCESEDKGEE